MEERKTKRGFIEWLERSVQNKKWLVQVGFLSILFLIACALSMFSLPAEQPLTPSPSVENEGLEETPSGDIVVHVDGAVENPGVYVLPEGSRIDDAVKRAGGLLEDADTLSINLAQRAEDGGKIMVPSQKDVESEGLSETVRTDNRININQATKEELKTLPGVGEVTAERIIAHREREGLFTTVEDLMKVERIGEKTFEKLKDKICV